MSLRLLAPLAALCAVALLTIQPSRIVLAQGGQEEQLKAAKADIDRIADMSDDKQRISAAQDFLKRFPNTYWRHVAYRLWLHGAWRATNLPEMKKAAEAYLKEYPDSPDSHGAVSRYYFEADFNRDQGLISARKALELYEKRLNTNGSLESLRTINSETAAQAPQPDYMPPGPRDTFINYLGSRFNLARYELAGGQRQSVLDLVEPVIQLDPFTADEEQTIAPFYFVAGQAQESLGDWQRAYRDYLGAVVLGDPQNRYASQAQARLRVATEKVEDFQRQAILQSFLPQPMAKLPLPRFTDITQAAGLSGVKAQRIAWADVDGDNDSDLLLDGSKLFNNDGASGFVDISKTWGLKPGRNAGLFADADNDGDLDLYTFGDGSRENRLLRNDRIGFADISAVAGSASPVCNCTAGAWLDYDADGWVDLYVAGLSQVPEGLGERQGDAAPDSLYRNEHGVLRQVDLQATESGVLDRTGAGVSAADFDSDGDADIYVANRDAHGSQLWDNTGGGAFLDRAPSVELLPSDGRYAFSSGADWGDVDNDDDLDLFVCNWLDPSDRYSYAPSAFYLAQPAESGVTFTDERAHKGIKSGGVLTEPCFGDYNNDGYLDLYITSSGVGQRSYFYVNDGAGGFHDFTYLSGSRVFGGLGCAHADFDRDGDLDLLICSTAGVRLLRNDTPDQNWLEVACIGGMEKGTAPGDEKPWSNAAAIGARVTVTLGADKFVREIQSGKGSGCGNEMVAHFGLGQRAGRMTLTVRFPSGRVVTRALMTANARVEIREFEPEAQQPRRPEQPPAVQRGLSR